MTKILQKYTISDGIFLSRQDNLKSIFQEALSLCSLSPLQSSNQQKNCQSKYCPRSIKMYIFSVELRFRRVGSRIEIQSSSKSTLLFFSSKYYPLSIQETSAKYFDSHIIFGSASVAFILHNSFYFFFLLFPMFCRQSRHFLSFPS